jgi:lysozyme
MPSPVVDLSHHNPTPDWAKLKAGGVVGVILKATEGTTYVDPDYASRRHDAEVIGGLCVASYHFMRPGSMKAQLDHFLGIVQPAKGERVVLDHEDDRVSLGELEQAVSILLADSRDLQVCVYSGHLIKEQLGSKHSSTLADTSLWIAQYTAASAPSWPTGTWPTWSLWQWTDSETVPGISAPVDGNRWNGSPDNLVKWFGPAAEPAPAPPPGPQIETVEVVIRIPAGLPYRVTVNDEIISG